MIIILMGVSGCGKTTVGIELARALGWDFHDADELHPAANVAKMRRGIALDDEDRRPWLDAVRALIERCLGESRGAVVACSALKRAYPVMRHIENKTDFRRLLALVEGEDRSPETRWRPPLHRVAGGSPCCCRALL